MTIKSNESLSMAETTEYIDKDSEIMKFIKRFTSMSYKEAGELRKKIDGLGLMKIKPEHVSKIIDIMPENHEDINKIFIGASLDEDESKGILDAIKEFK